MKRQSECEEKKIMKTLYYSRLADHFFRVIGFHLFVNNFKCFIAVYFVFVLKSCLNLFLKNLAKTRDSALCSFSKKLMVFVKDIGGTNF